MATLAFRAIEDDLVVYVGGDAPPDNAEWQAYVRHVEESARRASTKTHLYKFFVFVDDSSPNAAQRAAVLKAAAGMQVRSAIVTSSMVARKVITAFGWLGAPMRGFAPLDLRAAAGYLELPLERLPTVIRTARFLARNVGRVRAVEEIPEDLPQP